MNFYHNKYLKHMSSARRAPNPPVRRLSRPMANYVQLVDTVLEAYRSRELAAGGGFSLSQQHAFSCSQSLSQSNGGREWVSAKCRNALEGVEAEELHFLLRETGDGDLPDLLKALQYAFPCKTEDGARCWLAISKVCVLDLSLTGGRKGRDLMNFIVNQLDHLEGKSCVELVETILASIGPGFDENHTKCLELLPKLLAKVSQMKIVKPQDSASCKRPSEFSGTEYREFIISELCRMEWPGTAVVALITTIRDLQLSDEQLKCLVRKIAREAKQLDLQELPPFVYQVLLLSAQGQRQQFLREIFQLFNDLDEKSEQNLGRAQRGEVIQSGVKEEGLVHVEGTVLHYFLFARYESKAFDILKRAVEYENAYEYQRSISVWIDSIQDLAGPSAMTSVMKSVLRRSGKGWEHIMTGFVGFALNLLTCSSKKCSTKGQSSESQSGGTSMSGNRGIAKHMVSFSIQLLERAFRKHESVRNEILGQIFASVITRDDSVPHFVQLLSKITRTCSRDVMECLPKLKDALEYIGFMTPSTAVSLVRALEPILQVQSSLQDFFLIILRKSLTSREIESRLVALECLLYIAQTSNPVGAGGSSQHGLPAAGSGPDALAGEVISQIRRCLTQQTQLRQRLYDGLCDLVETKPALLDNVAAILLPQLTRYLSRDGDGSINALNLHDCVDEAGGSIIEPLPHLLRAMINCVHLSKSSQGTELDSLEQVNVLAAQKVLEKLGTWVAASELEDFELDKSADFEKPGILNLARLLGGVYEVFLEYIVQVAGLSSSTWLKRFFTIVERMRSLQEVIREQSKAAKGRKGAVSVSEDKATLLTCHVSSLLLAITGDQTPEGSNFDRAVCVSIFGNLQLMGLVLQTCSKQVTLMRASLDNGSAEAKARIFSELKAMIPLLHRQYYANVGTDRVLTSGGAGKKSGAAGKSLASLALDALDAALQLACSRFNIDEVSEIADGLMREIKGSRSSQSCGRSSGSQGPSASQSETHAKVSACIAKLQQEFDSLEAQADSEQVGHIMTILNPLFCALPNEDRAEHLPWIQKKCKSFQSFLAASPFTTKTLITAYLRLTSGEGKLVAAKALAGDVRIRLGLSEDSEGTEELGEAQHRIVIDETVPLVITALTDAVKSCCDDVDWVLAFLDNVQRQEALTDEDDDVPERVAAARAHAAVEDAAVGRLACLFDVTRILATADFQTVQASQEIVLSAVARAYRTAESAARRLAASRAKPSKAFVGLIQGIGTRMNEAMYACVFSYIKAQENAPSRAQISREQRLIPGLVYHVERLEAHLIKASAGAGARGVDLMRGFKRSTARDFRIDFAAVSNRLLQLDDAAAGGGGGGAGGKKGRAKKEGGAGRGRKRKADADGCGGEDDGEGAEDGADCGGGGGGGAAAGGGAAKKRRNRKKAVPAGDEYGDGA